MPTRMTREDFFSLWERQPDPVLIVDAAQRIRHVNLALESLLRHGREALLEQSIELLLPEASRARHHALADGFIRSGEHQRRLAHPRLIRAHRADGVDVPVEVTISAAEIEGERYFVLLLRDLSEQLALQDEVAALTQRLARIERMEALSTLSSGLASEFSDVLQRIKTRAVEAARLTEKDAVRDELDALLAEVESATHQTARLQLFARRDVTASLADPTQALGRAVQKARALAGPGVTISLIADPQLPPVAVVEHELEQAVTNLLNNGLHAMRERGGRLSILAHRLELEAPLPCTTLTLAPGSWLAVSVEDEGGGIDAAVQPRIFDPFFTTKPRNEGTGLGLAMVYGFVRNANGGLDVESRLGVGTRLTLFLPVNDLTAEGALVRTASRKRKVLLVDADGFAAASLKRSLELLGYACHVVSHAGDALSLVRLDPAAFDLVVAELNLPGMRGDELVSRMTLLRPTLPVCVIVGNERMPNADGFRVLRRPATAMDIDAVLRTLLPPTPQPWKSEPA